MPSIRKLTLAVITCAAVISASSARAEVWYGNEVGGSGGGRFEAKCHASEYLTGLEVRAGANIDAVRLLCSPITGRQGAFTVGPRRRDGQKYGGDGGGTLNTTCKTQSVVIGMVVNAGKYVTSIFLSCNPINALRRDRRGSVENMCPIGFVAAGVHGRHGSYVDQLGIICKTAPR